MKKLLGLMLAAAMLLAALPGLTVYGADIIDSGVCGADGDNLTWMLDGEGTLTISGTGDMEGDPDWNDHRLDIITVIIEPGVTGIGDWAFNDCRFLTGAAIPDSVTAIGDGAFSSCAGLTSITIPQSVTGIGDYAFSYCTGLAGIDVDASNPSYKSIGGVLYNKTGTELVQYPAGNETASYSIPAGVTDIAEYAFSGCTALKNVSIPDSVTVIGDYSFYSCTSLKSAVSSGAAGIGEWAFSGCRDLINVTVPSSVTSIGDHAFEGCESLANVYYRGTKAQWDDVSVGEYNDELIHAAIHYNFSGPAVEIIADGFCGDNLTWTLSGDGALTISGTGDMENSRSLFREYKPYIRSVMIEPGASAIGNWAFSGCESLESITIPDSVISIGQLAFEGCAGLAGVNIPGSVVTVGNYAFSGCRGLAEVSMEDGVAAIGEHAFSGCAGLGGIRIPASLTSIGESAFEGCTGLAEIDADEANPSYKSVDGVLFNKAATELIQYPIGNAGTSYSIPEGVTSIGFNAFNGCTDLAVVNIPDSVTTIGNFAFYGCAGLSGVSVPGSVTYIGGSAFYGCIGLAYMDLSESAVAYIGSYAFCGCTGLSGVSIPVSVRNIGESAFEGCESLDDVYYGGTEAQWDNVLVRSGNDCLLDANIHYIPADPDPGPQAPAIDVSIDIGGEAGEITIKAEAVNVPETAVVIAVGYGDDNALVSIAEVSDGDATLPADGVAKVKVLCWESLSSMRPLCEAKEAEVGIN